MKRLAVFTVLSFILIFTVARCAGTKNSVTPSLTPTQANTEIIPNPTSTATPSQPAGLVPTSTPQPQPTSTPALLPTPTLVPPTLVEPSSTPTSSVTVPDVSGSTEITATVQTSCINKAAFSQDVTYPDGALVKPDMKFTKVWQIRNVGTCDWSGYSLIYAGGDAMNAAMSYPIQEVKPDEYSNISVDFKAPVRGGLVTSYWQFQNTSGQTFGVGSGSQGLLWAQVTVDYPTPVPTTPTQESNPGPTTVSDPTSGTLGNCSYTENSDYENQILASINDARAQNGLGALTISSELSKAALAHSIDMACNDFISHTGSDGSTWYDRVKAQGFANYSSTRENIYVGNPAFGGDAQGAFTWWMNSKIHHDNILYPTVNEVGIAYIFNSASTYGGYYTLDLARP